MAQAAERNWPADKVQRWPIAKLIPNARNARTHSDAQVAQLAGSMKEWGWTAPVLVDEAGVIIAGHGRVLAGQLLGYDSVPVMIAKGWTEAQKRAYMLADNRLPQNAGWNDELLTIEMADLDSVGFDLSLIGFTQDEQNAILTGWASDYVPHERDGENLDGIMARVVIMVPQDDAAKAREVIGQALTGAEIEHEVR